MVKALLNVVRELIRLSMINITMNNVWPLNFEELLQEHAKYE